MFIGQYYHSLEEKGRLAIPAKFRRQLDKQSVITRGLDGCLFIFPGKEWKTFTQKLSTAPITRRDVREFIRLMAKQASEIELDKQGRTRIPKYLQEFASLKKQVVLVGSLKRIEIWDQKLYHQHIQAIEKKSESISDRLTDLEI